MTRIGPGSPEPLGVTLTPVGVNVAVFSAHATAIELCLFDAQGTREVTRISLPERTGDIFHGFVFDIVAGQRYGLRAHGAFDPRNGHRFNPAKLLIDPYAIADDPHTDSVATIEIQQRRSGFALSPKQSRLDCLRGRRMRSSARCAVPAQGRSVAPRGSVPRAEPEEGAHWPSSWRKFRFGSSR